MVSLTNLVSYWKLDEASGNALDAHGTNTLTDTNTVTSAAGKIGDSRHFTRTVPEYFTIADNASLSAPAGTSFTFSCWIYPDSRATSESILSKGTTDFLLAISSAAGNIQWTIGDGSSAFDTALTITSAISADATWFHVVCWYNADNNEVGMSINNGSPSTRTYGGAARANSTNPFRIGTQAENSANAFDGRIDEVGFWKRVLTVAERTSLYNGGNGLAYPFTG